MRTAFSDLTSDLSRTARVLGAGRVRAALDVDLPILGRALANAFAFGVAIAFADITIVLSAGRGSVVTFPVAIYRLMGFHSFPQAVALSVVYILVCVLLFALIDVTTPDRRRHAAAG
jgi:thiamine transport system permease protein